MPTRNPILAYRATLGIASAVGLVVAAFGMAGTSVSPVVLVVTFLAIFVGESIGFAHESRGTSVHWSLGGTATVAALLVAGTWQTVFMAVAASIAIDVRDRRPLWPTLETAAETATTLAATSLVLAGAGWQGLPAEFPRDLASTALAVLTYSAMNPLLAVVLRRTAQARSPRKTFLENLREWPMLAFNVAIGSSIGVLTALIYMVSPWALPYVLPLALSVHLAVLRGVRLQIVTDKALEAFANIVDERDHYTAEHSLRVCDYSMMIGEQLGLTPRHMEQLYWTSRLHDLGKISVDNTILNKPGRLTDEEFDVIKQHPVVSARVLSAFAFLERDAEIVLCHHERYDGRGYLQRTADTVPFESFIIAVADTYDAMTTDRPYRKALPREVALDEIERNMGTQFHPVAAEAFLAAMGWRNELPSDGTMECDAGTAASVTPLPVAAADAAEAAAADAAPAASSHDPAPGEDVPKAA